MFTEFKKFIMRGNVLDLAVGVIIGAAFGKIVASLVGDIFTPVLSLVTGKVDFANLFFALNGQHYDTLAEAKKAGAVVAYGVFINNVIEFVILAFVIFLIVRSANRMMPAPEPPPAGPAMKDCPECCTAVPVAAKRCPACTSVLPAA